MLDGFRELLRAEDASVFRINRQFNVSTLARLIRLGPLQFTKRLRAATGLSPHQYVMTSRIGRARELLSGSDMPLAEVALAVGFSGQSHFSISFRKMTGTTPALLAGAELAGKVTIAAAARYPRRNRIDFSIIAWMPLTLLTVCVTRRSQAMLHSE